MNRSMCEQIQELIGPHGLGLGRNVCLCGQPLGYVMYNHNLINRLVAGVQVQWLGRRGEGSAHH